MAKTTPCKNCHESVDAGFTYCPHCGQEMADNLTFGVLFSNTISNYFSVDARFFRSFLPLMIKPGVLARRFVDGKRLSYLHPAQFYLFISVLFFFLFSFSVRKADSSVNQALKKGFEQETVADSVKMERDSIALVKTREMLEKNKEAWHIPDESIQELDSAIADENRNTNLTFSFDRKKLDSLILAGAPEDEKLQAMGMDADAGTFTRRFYTQMLKFYNQQGGGILKAFYDTIPIAMFFMLPLFALLLKIFYWKRGTFAHHMVFSFYFFTFVFASFCVIILVNMLVDLPGWLEFLILMSFLIYLAISLRNFYKSSWIGAILKSGVIAFIYGLIIVPVAFVGIMMASFYLY